MRRALICLLLGVASVGGAGPVVAQADQKLLVPAAPGRPHNYPVNWWPQIGALSDAWYRSSEGRRAADNALSWQDESGGWPLMITLNEPWTGDESKAGPWGRRGALIKATVNEIRLLARAHRVTQDPRYRAAAEKGLDFILRAQYSHGGWPHSYPKFSNPYDRYATLNDDEMPDLMTLLREVTVAKDFDFLPAERRKTAQAAIDRGIDFILKTQIVVDGQRTAWCQQYDDRTLECRAARKFEPVAISGSESASVLLFLMKLERPSSEVAAAIRAGVEFYERAKIKGLRVEAANGDRVAHADPNAKPIWARFYEIPTMKPIFAGRDGIVKYSMAEIEQERRGGYAWYGNWGDAVLAEYKRWHARSAR